MATNTEGFAVFCFALDSIVSLRASGCPRTHSIGEAGLKHPTKSSTCLCLLNVELKGYTTSSQHCVHQTVRGQLARVSSLLLYGFRGLNLVIRVGSKHLYLLNHLAVFFHETNCVILLALGIANTQGPYFFFFLIHY